MLHTPKLLIQLYILVGYTDSKWCVLITRHNFLICSHMNMAEDNEIRLSDTEDEDSAEDNEIRLSDIEDEDYFSIMHVPKGKQCEESIHEDKQRMYTSEQ